MNIPQSAAIHKAVQVQTAFQDNRGNYNELLKVLKDFKDQRIYTRGATARVKDTHLILGFNMFLPKEHQITLPFQLETTAIHKAVQAAFQGKGGNYNQLLNVLKDVKDQRIYTHLILGFNTFLPKEHQITLPFQLETTGKKVKKIEENRELLWDVLDIISRTLDFDDLFQFSGVCKNLRAFHKIYRRNFLASQEPLILQISYHCTRSISFISVPDQKVYYCLKIKKYFMEYTYATSSSGYFIMVGRNNSVLLINPFTRIKKVINTCPFDAKSHLSPNRAVLAFGKCSEEFFLVVFCNYLGSLHVYQSRNCGWVTYSTIRNEGRVVDFVVLHNLIYVVTTKANLGVLSLNSANIKFLKLKNTPNETFSLSLRLVNCDEQLLVVDLRFDEVRNVYKIDFSTMNYVKLKTLGDIALFYAWNRNFYALSNPDKWGYESNHVYALSDPLCCVYSGDDKKLKKLITLPAPHGANSFMLDWCFRHLQYEVDHSLVE